MNFMNTYVLILYVTDTSLFDRLHSTLSVGETGEAKVISEIYDGHFEGSFDITETFYS